MLPRAMVRRPAIAVLAAALFAFPAETGAQTRTVVVPAGAAVVVPPRGSALPRPAPKPVTQRPRLPPIPPAREGGGTGLGGAGTVAAEVGERAGATAYAHNGYLQALSDGGLLLCLPLLVVLVTLAWAVLRALPAAVARADLVQVGAAVTLLVLGLHSGMDFDWAYPSLLLLVPLLSLTFVWAFATVITGRQAARLLATSSVTEQVARPTGDTVRVLQQERRRTLVHLLLQGQVKEARQQAGGRRPARELPAHRASAQPPRCFLLGLVWTPEK